MTLSMSSAQLFSSSARAGRRSRALSVSQGKDAVVQRQFRAADVLLFRLPQGRKTSSPFLMAVENVDFPTAARMLAERAGIRIEIDEGASGEKGREQRRSFQTQRTDRPILSARPARPRQRRRRAKISRRAEARQRHRRTVRHRLRAAAKGRARDVAKKNKFTIAQNGRRRTA